MTASRRRLFSDAPVWVSGFRPFYLLGALYAPILVVGASGAFGGMVDLPAIGSTPALWHGHEMIFGFAMAIIIGTLLTALPSWAGTPELRGSALALLAALWLIGRLALWSSPILPKPLTAAADLLLLPALLTLLWPGVWRAPNRLFRWLLPVLLALALANGIYHAGMLRGDLALARLGLRAGVYAVVILFVLKGGVLTPIFTGNALRASGQGEQASFDMRLEAVAACGVALLALLDLAGAPAPWIGSAALACAIVHAVRTARWRGWRVARQPLLSVMHLSFFWLISAFGLKSVAEFTGLVPETAWLHVFTVGSLGLMMLGLMTRVVLRHTGRPLVVPGSLRLAYSILFAAVPIRLAADMPGPWAAWLALMAALLWAGAFSIYFVVFARTLITPSLPRGAPLRP
jgi:uncharacterized protein involved in response to NO